MCQVFVWKIYTPSRRVTGSSLCSFSNGLPIRMFSIACLFSCGVMHTCNHGRRYTTSLCLLRICQIWFSEGFPEFFALLMTNSDSARLSETADFSSNHSLSTWTAIGLAMLGRCFFLSRCILVKMDSAALFLTSTDDHSCWRSWFRGCWIPSGTWEKQSDTRCMAWIFLAFDVGLRLFLTRDQWWAFLISHRSQREISSSLLELIMKMRLRTSRICQ